jgi:hypothetical protein
LRSAGVRFRNEIVTGVGGKQIILEDPSGNPSSSSNRSCPRRALIPGSKRSVPGRPRLA